MQSVLLFWRQLGRWREQKWMTSLASVFVQCSFIDVNENSCSVRELVKLTSAGLKISTEESLIWSAEVKPCLDYPQQETVTLDLLQFLGKANLRVIFRPSFLSPPLFLSLLFLPCYGISHDIFTWKMISASFNLIVMALYRVGCLYKKNSWRHLGDKSVLCACSFSSHKEHFFGNVWHESWNIKQYWQYWPSIFTFNNGLVYDLC